MLNDAEGCMNMASDDISKGTQPPVVRESGVHPNPPKNSHPFSHNDLLKRLTRLEELADRHERILCRLDNYVKKQNVDMNDGDSWGIYA